MVAAPIGRSVILNEMKKNILFTGRPGVGKTTVIMKLIGGLEGAGGFYTEEIRQRGERKGFRIVTLRGKKGILAHKDLNSSYRVGKYGVNIEDLENIAGKSILLALDDAKKKIILIDEIGRMELYSPKFQEAVIKALDSSKRVIGTLQERHNKFTDAIREREDVELIEVTLENRKRLIEELKKEIL
jgi:nucleoside-triphosphatase